MRLIVPLGLVFTAAASYWVASSRPAVSSAPETERSIRVAGERIILSPDAAADLAAKGLVPEHTRSVLDVRRRLRHGQFIWDETGVPSGPTQVRVDLSKQLISVFRAGHEIGTAVVTFGAKGKDTPTGVLHVLAKFRDHRSSAYDAEMPYTLRLTDDGVSLHGSDVRWGTATHGCIGLPNDFARRLFDQVDVGQAISVTGEHPRS